MDEPSHYLSHFEEHVFQFCTEERKQTASRMRVVRKVLLNNNWEDTVTLLLRRCAVKYFQEKKWERLSCVKSSSSGSEVWREEEQVQVERPGRRSHISVRRGENIVYITSADGLPTSHAECVWQRREVLQLNPHLLTAEAGPRIDG